MPPQTKAHPSRGPAMMMQLHLFTAQTEPLHQVDAPTDPVHGLSVQLSDICQCGSRDAIVGEGKGLQRAAFFCSQCERHRGWMPNEAHSFVAEIVKKFGKPTAPIRIRRNRTNQEA
jgi:hypothetical protein